MHETTDSNSLVTPSTARVRELTKNVYINYVIEAESTADAYEALATLAREVEEDFGIVEGVAPSFHFDDELPYHLLVTVAR